MNLVRTENGLQVHAGGVPDNRDIEPGSQVAARYTLAWNTDLLKLSDGGWILVRRDGTRGGCRSDRYASITKAVKAHRTGLVVYHPLSGQEPDLR